MNRSGRSNDEALAIDSRKSIVLLSASALFFVASAFGVLKIPGLDITYANAALIALGLASIYAGRFGDVRPFFFLLALMALDLFFRAWQSKMQGVGYSVNIGKMALFALVAKQLTRTGSKGRHFLAVAFGVAALCSEVFVLAYPSYREDLYAVGGAIADVDGGDSIIGLSYRPTGLIGDPNYFAVPLVIMAVALYLRQRYVWFMIAALCVAATGSRAALLALFLPMVLHQLAGARSRPLSLIAVLARWTLVLLLAAWLNETLRGDTSDSNRERAMLLAQAVENVLSLSFLHSVYGEPLGMGIDGDPLVIHNTFLQTAVTSALLASYFIYRSLAGLLRSNDRLILGSVILEMLFLDISSFAAIFFGFFVFSEQSRPEPAAAVAPVRHRSTLPHRRDSHAS